MSSTQTIALKSAAAAAVIASMAPPTMNLEKVMAKVKKEHPDWSQQRLDAAEDQYRQHWAACKAAPGTGLDPTDDADIVWHIHLQFLRSYLDSSVAYFGYVFMHEPGETMENGDCPNKCPDGEIGPRLTVVPVAVN